jgi:hypothetical protein
MSVGNEINKVIDNLAEKLGVLTLDIFEIYVRQARITGITNIIIIVVLLTAIILLSAKSYSAFSEGDTEEFVLFFWNSNCFHNGNSCFSLNSKNNNLFL